MPRLFCSAVLALSLTVPAAAFAQSVGGTGSGMDSNFGSMSGPNLNVDNGINAHGTPKQQSPGVSMTNGQTPSGMANSTPTQGAPAGIGTPNPPGVPAPAGGPGGGLGMGGSSGGTTSATAGGGAGK